MGDVVTDDTAVTRRRLLAGTAVGTALTLVPGMAGALVPAEPIVGGEATAIGRAAAANRPAALAKVGPIGSNPDFYGATYYGDQCMYLDHSRASSVWVCGFNDGSSVTEGVDGYPVHSSKGGAFCYVPFDNPAKHPGIPVRYALVTSWTSSRPSISNVAHAVRSTMPDGRLRLEFDVVDATFVGGQPFGQVNVENVNAHPWPDGAPRAADGTDPWYIVRVDQEAKYKAGRRFSDDQLKTSRSYGYLRVMNLAGINGDYKDLTTVDRLTPLPYSRWNVEYQSTRNADGRAQFMPLAAQIMLANEAGVSIWLNMQWATADGQAALFFQMVDRLLDPHLSAFVELGNEPWNTGGNFNFGWGHFHGRYNPPIVPSDDPAWSGYGYRAAQLMAEGLRAVGYSRRFRPVVNVQATRSEAAQGVMTGVVKCIADWGDRGNPVHDAELAARFTEPGKLFANIALAPYLDAGVNNALSAADRAVVEGWASAADDSGLAALFEQLDGGGHLPSANAGYYINTIPQAFAGQQAVAVQYQLPLVAYELQIAITDLWSATANAFIKRALADPRMKQRIIDYGTKCFEAGFEMLSVFTDISIFTPYGSQTKPWDFTAPRYLGWKALQDDPPPPAPLRIEAVTDGAYTLGKNPTTRLKVTGGRGLKTVTVSGLAPGRTFDGFRTVTGTLARTGGRPSKAIVHDEFGNTASVAFADAVAAPVALPVAARLATPGGTQGTATVTDEFGNTASVTFAQEVAAPAHGYRFVKVTPLSNLQLVRSDDNPRFRVGTAENVLRNRSGDAIPFVPGARAVSGSADGGNVPGRIVDGALVSSYITLANGNVGGGEYVIDLGDGTAAVPAAIDLYACPEAFQLSMASVRIAVAKDTAKGLGRTPSYADILAGASFIEVADLPPGGPNHDQPNSRMTYTNQTSGYCRVPLTYPAGAGDRRRAGPAATDARPLRPRRRSG